PLAWLDADRLDLSAVPLHHGNLARLLDEEVSRRGGDRSGGLHAHHPPHDLAVRAGTVWRAVRTNLGDFTRQRRRPPLRNLPHPRRVAADRARLSGGLAARAAHRLANASDRHPRPAARLLGLARFSAGRR